MNDSFNKQSEIIFQKDREWNLIDGELCLVTDFYPIKDASVINGAIACYAPTNPYAVVKLECIKVQNEIKGIINHKMDFINLWAAFKESGINTEKHEVLIYWSRKRYKNKILKVFSSILPKMVVMICPKGTYKSCSDGFPLLQEEKRILVFVYGLMAKKWWVPDVMNESVRFGNRGRGFSTESDR